MWVLLHSHVSADKAQSLGSAETTDQGTGVSIWLQLLTAWNWVLRERRDIHGKQTVDVS